MSFRKIFLLLLLCCSTNVGWSKNQYALIPQPKELIPQKGTFKINSATKILVGSTNEQVRKTAELLAETLFRAGGIQVPVTETTGETGQVNSLGFFITADTSLGPEGYRMAVGKKMVVIHANTPRGHFYALQTLLQLMPPLIYATDNTYSGTLSIPCCTITDAPRFGYRGLHLDVARHFFTVAEVKKYIDLLALHKMNTFHWHLTDDQGWRIEIKKYPLLTTVGSKRKETMAGRYDDNKKDGIPYEGFFTQDEIRDVVAYAQERYITVIPEIEMPGHALAALAAYPNLACIPGPYEVATIWGVFDDVFCPTEETFHFLEDVLTEVCTLFPGTYIHIGGDECPKTRWKNSDYCQQLMKREGLKDEHELQSYFIRRIENFLATKGKKIIGWDEILDGGLAPGATVLSWRGINGGIAAARQDHDVIMAPGSHCYFDHYQSDPATEPVAIGGYTPIKKVYAFDPVPADSLTAEQQTHILGAQANLWSEYLTSFKQVQYMAYPRACALSEVLWSPAGTRNWDDFSKRLLKHFKRLDALKVNYAKSIFDLTATTSADTVKNQLTVTFQKSIPAGEIHYTTNGTEPYRKFYIYTGPFRLTKSSEVKAILYHQDEIGNTLTRKFTVHKATAKKYTLTYPWKQYDGGNAFGLTDGVSGIVNQYNTWVGFSGNNLDIAIDLREKQPVQKISVNFYNKNRDWIFLPTTVEFFTSDDGNNYQSVKKVTVVSDGAANSIVNALAEIPSTQSRFIRVVATSAGKIPEGFEGAGQDAWLFADEVVVE